MRGRVRLGLLILVLCMATVISTASATRYYLDHWEVRPYGYGETQTFTQLDNWTFTVNPSSVTTTNATGSHIYHFLVSYANGSNAWEIRLDNLNRTTSDLRIDYNGSPAYEQLGANGTSYTITANDGMIKVYVNSEQVWQYAQQPYIELLSYYTDDYYTNSTSYPSAFEGNFLVSISGYAQVTGLQNYDIIGIGTTIAIAVMVLGMAKRLGK